MQPLAVIKFGGSTLAGSESLIKAADICADLLADHTKKLVVVVSALKGQTDALIRQANEVSTSPDPRELDMLISIGERVSMSLLSMALRSKGIKSLSVTGSQCGIVTVGPHTTASVLRVELSRLQKYLATADVLVVAGFQGVDSTTKEITTLGRGGSDVTAMALAIALGCDECILYKDEGALYSSDPKTTAHAKLLRTQSLKSLYSLSPFGLKVIQERALFLALKYEIKIRIVPFKSGLKDEGSLLTSESSSDAQMYVLGSQNFDPQTRGLILLGVTYPLDARPRFFSSLQIILSKTSQQQVKYLKVEPERSTIGFSTTVEAQDFLGLLLAGV